MTRTVDPRVLAGVGGVIAFVGVLWLLTAGPLGGDDEPEVETRVVTVAVETDDAADAPVGPLGFPLVATRNTTRVGGPDAATDAAAIALATHPRTSADDPIEAAILVGPRRLAGRASPPRCWRARRCGRRSSSATTTGCPR